MSKIDYNAQLAFLDAQIDSMKQSVHNLTVQIKKMEAYKEELKQQQKKQQQK